VIVGTGERTLRIGTRASRLARLQTRLVAAELARRNPGLDPTEVILTTLGDQDERTPLTAMGGKGVFTETLERALREGTIDCAVHSLKDLPVEPSPGLVLAAVGFRDDPRDVLVSARGWTLETLPQAGAVGTCSLRRRAQLLAVRPDLRIVPLRGNVDTRVRKALDGDYDAIVIAAAGVQRLGLSSGVSEYLPLELMLPAPGQGALAVQCRADDEPTRATLAALDDPAAREATAAERGFLEGLGGGCTAPVGAWGRVTNRRLALEGVVASADGGTIVRVRRDGSADDGRREGLALAEEALVRGAAALLA
jgi:hydroxymethylbilane synthase